MQIWNGLVKLPLVAVALKVSLAYVESDSKTFYPAAHLLKQLLNTKRHSVDGTQSAWTEIIEDLVEQLGCKRARSPAVATHVG